MHRRVFAEFLYHCSGETDRLSRPVFNENTYLFPQQPNNNPVPHGDHLLLSPRKKLDMHGEERWSAMTEVQPDGTLDEMLESILKFDPFVAAVHEGVSESPLSIDEIRPKSFLYLELSHARLALDAHRVNAQDVLAKAIDLKGHRPILNIVRRGRQQRFPSSITRAYEFPIPNGCLLGGRPINWDIPVQKDLVEQEGGARTLVLREVHRELGVMPFRKRKQNKDPPEPAIRSAYAKFRLHEEQAYLGELLDKQAMLLHFRRRTTTCEAKRLVLREQYKLDVSLDRIHSAHYFRLGDDRFAGLIGPQMQHIPDRLGIVESIFGKATYSDQSIPIGMERGTCTPFARTSLAEKMAGFIFLQLPTSLEQQLADYSIGGYGESAHRTSVLMPPYVARRLVSETFPGKVYEVPHPFPALAPQR